MRRVSILGFRVPWLLLAALVVGAGFLFGLDGALVFVGVVALLIICSLGAGGAGTGGGAGAVAASGGAGAVSSGGSVISRGTLRPPGAR